MKKFKLIVIFSIDASTFLLINQRLEHQDIYGNYTSYFEDKNCIFKI